MAVLYYLRTWRSQLWSAARNNYHTVHIEWQSQSHRSKSVHYLIAGERARERERERDYYAWTWNTILVCCAYNCMGKSECPTCIPTLESIDRSEGHRFHSCTAWRHTNVPQPLPANQTRTHTHTHTCTRKHTCTHKPKDIETYTLMSRQPNKSIMVKCLDCWCTQD